MEIIFTFFRWIGLVSGYPVQLLLFKRRTFYEDRAAVNLRNGGKLIISNHFNFLDYVLTSFIVFPRKLNVVCAEFAFKSPIVRFGMRFFGAIKADRITRSMRFVDQCAETIKRGQLVQIFPEGHNTPDGEIHEFKHSYIVIAHRAKCPIVPIVSDGRYGLFKRTSVIIGKEIDLSQFISSDKRTPTREELESANEYIHSKVLELRRELEVRKNEKARRK